MIVVPSPSIDKDLRLIESIKDLTIKQFISEFPVEGFDITVLPWTSRGDVQGLDADLLQPLPDIVCCEL